MSESDNERLHRFLGLFIQGMAIYEKHQADPAFVNHPRPADQRHRDRLTQIRDLLVRVPLTGHELVAGSHPSEWERIPMTPDTMRALARDANANGDWWFDPDAEGGISEHFPGRSLNPNAT